LCTAKDMVLIKPPDTKLTVLGAIHSKQPGTGT
jgi:hypothetical protein